MHLDRLPARAANSAASEWAAAGARGLQGQFPIFLNCARGWVAGAADTPAGERAAAGARGLQGRLPAAAAAAEAVRRRVAGGRAALRGAQRGGAAGDDRAAVGRQAGRQISLILQPNTSQRHQASHPLKLSQSWNISLSPSALPAYETACASAGWHTSCSQHPGYWRVQVLWVPATRQIAAAALNLHPTVHQALRKKLDAVAAGIWSFTAVLHD